MKRKHKLSYWVESDDGYWWCPSLRKWIGIRENIKRGLSSSCVCYTFDRAFKVARKVTTGMVIITQFRWKRGHRYSREYYYRRSR